VYAYHPDDYYFGALAKSGYSVLGLLPDNEAPRVLDIGAGDGLFLRGILDKPQYRDVQALAFTALERGHSGDDTGISWISGDFQRRGTWKPNDAIRPESVDLAVSALTFVHLVHPLRALVNAYDTLSLGGHLLIDLVRFELNPDTPDVADLIVGAIVDNAVERPLQLDRDNQTMTIRGLHLTKEKPMSLDGLEASMSNNKIVYGAAL
jgi:SAM-dependent methyltransferase